MAPAGSCLTVHLQPLTEHIARELYDHEADEVMGASAQQDPADSRIPALAPLPRPEYRVRKDGLLQTGNRRFLATRYNKFVTTRQGTS